MYVLVLHLYHGLILASDLCGLNIGIMSYCWFRLEPVLEIRYLYVK